MLPSDPPPLLPPGSAIRPASSSRRRARRPARVAVLAGLLGMLAPAAALAREAPPADAAAETPPGAVFVVPIEGMISPGVVAFVRRGIDAAREAEASTIVFEIDTEGGRVDSAITICQLIDDASPIPTVAYVKHKAWSAGALISIAADRIYMDDVATIGSAAPVSLSPDGQASALGEKYVAALRAEFRAWSERKGYPATLAVAMVDQDVEVLEVEIDGARRFVTPDELASARRERVPDDDGEGTVEGIRVVRTVIAEGKLLHLTASEALETGFASGVVENRDALMAALGDAEVPVRALAFSWSELLVQWLTHPTIAGLLLMAGFAGIWLELKTPGFGAPGVIGIICLALLFGSGYLAGLAEVQEILLFGIGVALLAIEIFVVPGFGVLGIAGLACMLIAFVLALQTVNLPSPDIPWEMDAFRGALQALTIGILGSLGAVVVAARLLPGAPGLRRLVLTAELDAADGYTSERAEDRALEGQEGVAMSDLRPVGTVRFGERVEQAGTDGEWVEKGTRVRVTRTDGNRILVEPIG